VTGAALHPLKLRDLFNVVLRMTLGAGGHLGHLIRHPYDHHDDGIQGAAAGADSHKQRLGGNQHGIHWHCAHVSTHWGCTCTVK